MNLKREKSICSEIRGNYLKEVMESELGEEGWKEIVTVLENNE